MELRQSKTSQIVWRGRYFGDKEASEVQQKVWHKTKTGIQNKGYIQSTVEGYGSIILDAVFTFL